MTARQAALPGRLLEENESELIVFSMFCSKLMQIEDTDSQLEDAAQAHVAEQGVKIPPPPLLLKKTQLLTT